MFCQTALNISKRIAALAMPILFIAVSSSPLMAQNSNFSYQQLSAVCYKGYSDSLKKNSACPKVYKDKKTQKEYELSWDSRVKSITTDIERNHFIKDDVVLPYIESIVNELYAANTALMPVKPKVLLDRTEIPNAYAFGERIIVVNTGLIMHVQSREELAFYISHEMAHDILKHSDNSMRKRAELVTSDEYKESLKNILSSEYERYSKLKSIFEGYTFDRSRHSRYSESEADSLGIVILKNAHLTFDAAYFLNLDTMDNDYERELKSSVKQHFEELNLTVNDAWLTKKAKGLSNANHNFKDTTTKADSVKTHPDCIVRYERTKVNNSENQNKTPLPDAVKDACFAIAINNMIKNDKLCHALYKLMQKKEQKPQLQDYEFDVDYIMHSLLFSTRDMKRFSVLRIQKKKDVSKAYFELQGLLEQIPEANIAEYCKKLDEKLSTFGKEQIALLAYFNTVNSENTPDKKDRAAENIKNFKTNFPNSVYLELFNN